jgi:3-dehydroquinate synthase
MPTIRVKLHKAGYPIVVGSNQATRLRSLIEARKSIQRLFVFYDAQLYALHSDYMRAAFKGWETLEFVLPRGERTKSQTTLGRLHDFLLTASISRSDFILACGGGVTTDVVGFAAATVLRGVSWGAVPSTLLGMVDAAIGGKTGINSPQGKNLIGAFWQPSFVLCDTRLLKTLPRRQMVAGLGEVAKYGGIEGEALLEPLSRLLSKDDLYDERLLARIIFRSAAAKARIVTSDERDMGVRMLLNLGHTFAHGIEKAAGYGRILHGEAVIIGLLAAWELSVLTGARETSKMTAYRSIIEQLLRHIPYRRVELDAVWHAMALDKKRQERKLRFVLLSRPGRAFLCDTVEVRAAKKALDRSLRRYAETGGTDAKNTGRQRPKP